MVYKAEVSVPGVASCSIVIFDARLPNFGLVRWKYCNLGPVEFWASRGGIPSGEVSPTLPKSSAIRRCLAGPVQIARNCIGCLPQRDCPKGYQYGSHLVALLKSVLPPVNDSSRLYQSVSPFLWDETCGLSADGDYFSV